MLWRRLTVASCTGVNHGFVLVQRGRTASLQECVCFSRRTIANEELNDLYSSPNIVRVIKSRRMRWAGHVARMGEERGCIGSWWGNRRE